MAVTCFILLCVALGMTVLPSKVDDVSMSCCWVTKRPDVQWPKATTIQLVPAPAAQVDQLHGGSGLDSGDLSWSWLSWARVARLTLARPAHLSASCPWGSRELSLLRPALKPTRTFQKVTTELPEDKGKPARPLRPKPGAQHHDFCHCRSPGQHPLES